MSSKVYIVVSEEWYGGSNIRVFNTDDAKEDAESYAKKWIEKTGGKIDVIVKEVDMAEM